MPAGESVAAYKVGDTVVTEIFVYDSAGAGKSGLVQGGFTLDTPHVWVDGAAANGVSITLTEESAGNRVGAYKITFVPGVAGLHSFRIRHATYKITGWSQSWQIAAGAIAEIVDLLKFLEEDAGKGRRLSSFAWDSNGNLITVTLTTSADGFTTTHRTYTITYTYGDSDHPHRPTRIQWS